MTEMTLAEATDLLRGGWPCACSGPGPGTQGLCWCAWTFAQARGLNRAAHIVARQVADLAARRDATGSD